MTNQVQQANHDKKQPTSSKPTPSAPKAASPPPTTPPAEPTVDAGKRKVKRKIYICVGQVKEMDSMVDAEKYVNGENAPKEFTAIKGLAIDPKHKVSLR
jgi:hypothetical protein